MSRFKFVMDDGSEFQCLAKNINAACKLFNELSYPADPKKIMYIEEQQRQARR